MPARELEREIEAMQWLVLDLTDDLGDSLEVAMIQLEALLDEQSRRRRLLERHMGHPLAPRWPQREHTFRTRADAVKAILTPERLCMDVLGVSLSRAGDHWVARCPFPGHDDHSPSCHVYGDHVWCFGCNRGGDVISTLRLASNMFDASEALETLEAYLGITTGGAR